MWARKRESGFTIVELLIVIVVIAILAAITIVAYNGIQDRARNSTAASSSSQAAKKIKVWQVDNEAVSPTCTQFYAIITGGSSSSCSFDYKDTNYQYTAGTNGAFCITATVVNKSYKVSESITPTSGGCAGHGQGGVAAITNLATNPSGEVNGGWYSNNGATYLVAWDTSVKRSGTRSQSGYNNNGSITLLSLYSVGANDGLGFPITQSGQYTYSVYFRADVPHQAYLRAAYRLSGVYTTLSGPTIPGTPGTWTMATFTFNVPAGSDILRLAIDVNSTTAQPVGTKAWADDAIVTYGTNTYSYADGTSTDWAWNGTPNTSTSTGPPL